MLFNFILFIFFYFYIIFIIIFIFFCYFNLFIFCYLFILFVYFYFFIFILINKKWHEEDPVSNEERDRNEIIYLYYQNNRNPFVDHPEWVDKIYDF